MVEDDPEARPTMREALDRVLAMDESELVQVEAVELVPDDVEVCDEEQQPRVL